MKKRNSSKWFVILLTIMLLAVSAPAAPVQAASATITVSSTTEEIYVGDTVEVILTIKADTTIGDFEGYISYDDSVFEFCGAAACITGGAGILKISDIGASPSAQERSYKITFNAIEKGECKIALHGRPVVYGYSDGEEMSVTGSSKTFLVYPPQTASSDTSLATLHLIDSRIKTIELIPKFSPETTTYYGSVPYDVTSVIVSALATDEKASVRISGDGDIAYGNNEICITVVAENGAETEYYVYIYRGEKTTPTPTVKPTATPVPTRKPTATPTPKATATPTSKVTPGLTPTAVPTQGITPVPTEVPEVSVTPEQSLEQGIVLDVTETGILLTEYHTYRVCEKPETFILPDGYVETTLRMNETEITAYGKQGADEEFLLLVLANEYGQVQWYRYDRAERTVQRVSDELFTITQQVISNDDAWKEAVEKYERQQSGLIIAVSVLVGICVFLGGVIGWIFLRNRRQKHEE